MHGTGNAIWSKSFSREGGFIQVDSKRTGEGKGNSYKRRFCRTESGKMGTFKGKDGKVQEGNQRRTSLNNLYKKT